MTGCSDYEDWKLVYTCTDEMEADMIESFLKGEQIQTLRKYPGFSDISRIVAGMTRLGISIYVKESRWAEAAEVVEAVTADFRETE